MGAEALLSAGGDVGGALVNNLFNIGQAKKQRKFQREMADYAYTKDLEMWNRANEYNDPSAQMARLKKAGLNPNLIYGSSAGGASGTTSTAMPKYQRYDTPVQMIEIPRALQVMQAYQNLRIGKQKENNMREQNANLVVQRDLMAINKLKSMAQTAKTNADRIKIEKMLNVQYDIAQKNSQILGYDLDIKQKDADLAKMGLRPGDSIWARALLDPKMSNQLKNRIQELGKYLFPDNYVNPLRQMNINFGELKGLYQKSDPDTKKFFWKQGLKELLRFR